MGSVSLTAWVSYRFDRPVSDPAWDFELHAPWLDPAAGRLAELIAETFERAGTLLQPFSHAQLNQGSSWAVRTPPCPDERVGRPASASASAAL
jgi:hypothetical protein